MLYLSGIHALNINCELDTCGDWHQSALQWHQLPLLESEGSLFGDYGIETSKKIPGHIELYNVANHIRALLDLMQQGRFSVAQGMKEDFICNNSYTPEVFDKIFLMRNEKNWNDIDSFMEKEYFEEWISFKNKNQVDV